MRERHRANQVDALTTHQLQVERRESQEPNKCMRSPPPATGGEERESKSQQVDALTTPATGGEEMRVIEPIKLCARHTPATGGEERES